MKFHKKVHFDKVNVNQNPGSCILRACGRLMLYCIIIGVLLRIALALHPLTVASSLSFGQWIGVFLLGIVNDFCVTSLMLIPLVAFWMSSGHWKFRRPQSWVFIALILALWCWVTFGWKQLHDFNRGLTYALSGLIIFWLLTFVLRTYIPSMRKGWMKVFTAIFMFVYTFVPVFNAVGEWLFWNEFGVRYNFIAVDYLVYTSEVVGNIMQSYSTGWIIAISLVAGVLLEWLLFRRVIAASTSFHRAGWRLKITGVLLPEVVVSAVILPLSDNWRQSENQWYNELQANGIYSFVKAFFDNELAYNDFYVTVSDAVLKDAMPPADVVADSVQKQYPNVVLITMESMSADYMQRFGNTDNLTPSLDSLWNHALAFDRMFAAGNRTVRGLEALIMSRPPTPGESIIKRPGDYSHLPSVVSSFRGNDYDCRFYYGGDSYFDNMESFFSGLGYRICDRKSMVDADITCQTVWGVCDGDVYKRIVNDMDSAYKVGNRVFAHLMTTSNHRPYIYPDGCVSIPPSKKSRKGAVMYSDYALGQFFKEAMKHPWAENTVFVVVADHCASSAGSTELPLANYHIPALIYAPGLIAPQVVDKTASQVDIMPTLFAMLGWELPAGLYGRNILSDDYKQKAYLATYQDLGYLENDTLTVLSPGRKVRQYEIVPTVADPFGMRLLDRPSQAATNKAAAQYQSASNEL